MAITGEQVARVRAKLRLSRDKFAQRVGLTPGAVWRIEAKGTFKSGEVDKLTAVVTETLADPGETTTAAPATPLVSVVPELVKQPGTVMFHGVAVPISSVLAVTSSGGVTAAAPQPQPQQPQLHLTPLPEPTVVNAPELSPYQRFLEDGIRRYSNSEIQTFKRCRRKWYLAYYRRLHLKNQSPVGARAIGDRLHRALRWHYHPNPKLRLDARDAIEAIIALDYAELRRRYDPELIPLSLESKFVEESDLERVMIAGYREWVEQTGADADFVITGAEEYVEADLALPGGQLVKLVGRLDARARRVSDGARLFIDHKSVGSIEGITKTLLLNEQMKKYILLENLNAQQTGATERVDGAIFNMLRRVKRSVKAKPPFYHRVEVRHNPTAIKNFTTQLTSVIIEIERVRAELDAGGDHRVLAYPTPLSDCTWSCDFMQLDTLMDDGSYWEAMANAFYEVGDPSAYYVKTDVIAPV